MSAWPQAWLLPPGTPAPSYPRASKKGDAASTPSTNYPSLNWYHVFPSGFKAAARFAVTVDKLRCHLWQSDNLSRSAEAEQRERGKAGGGVCVIRRTLPGKPRFGMRASRPAARLPARWPHGVPGAGTKWGTLKKYSGETPRLPPLRGPLMGTQSNFLFFRDFFAVFVSKVRAGGCVHERTFGLGFSQKCLYSWEKARASL